MCKQTAGKFVGLSKIDHAAVDIVRMCAVWTDPAELHAWGPKVGGGQGYETAVCRSALICGTGSSKRIQARQLLLAVAASMRSGSLSNVLGALLLLSSGCQAGIPLGKVLDSKARH